MMCMLGLFNPMMSNQGSMRHFNLSNLQKLQEEAWEEETDNGRCSDVCMAHQKKYKVKSTYLRLPACSTGPGSVTAIFKSCVTHKKALWVNMVPETCNIMENQ